LNGAVPAVAVASQKGGVGKTTVALNLAYAWARRGLRTALVDVDPQGAIGLSLSKRLSHGPGLWDWLHGRALRPLMVKTRLEALTLLPAGRIPATESQAFQARLEDGAVLGRLLGELEDFALVLFDTPSGFVGATLGALRASRWALTPVQAEPIAARTLMRTVETIGALRREGAGVELLGILLTMVQRGDASSAAIADDLWRTVPRHLMLDSHIPRDPLLLEASNAGVPVGLLRKRPPAVALEFDQLAAELEERMGLHGKEGPDAPVSLVD
jgi:chromosome partitioning protein